LVLPLLWAFVSWNSSPRGRSVHLAQSLISIQTDNAIFNSALNEKLGSGIAAAVMPLGLPPTSLEAFIGALAGQAPPAQIAAIPGVTPQIIGAGVGALKDAFLNSFKWVYVAAAVISAVSAIGKPNKRNPMKRLSVANYCF
jgi:hypothetical protein